jgi:Ser/Thr protein kinase RdoA (MazF antagonist)
MIPQIADFLKSAPPDPEQQRMAREMTEMVAQMPSFEGLPQGLIHTDPYLVNLVEDPSGTLYLIDWDDGGVSYPLLDVAYVAHLCTYPRHEAARWQVIGPSAEKFGLIWKPEWMRTFLAAYQSVRPLSALEKERFAAAVRLSFLIYIWDWDNRRLITENYERMKILDQFIPWET